jgi:hypothetical protein
VLLDLAGPLAVFYGLRASGTGDLTALAASSAPPLLHLALVALRERRLAPMSVVALVVLLAGLVSVAVAGDVRDLLARDAAIGAPFGLWMLATLWRPRPFCFTATRALLPRRAPIMDELWAVDPSFRRVWRIDTAVWGSVGLADSALRVAMAYALPVAVVPALGAALSVTSLLALQLPTHLLLRSSGHWHALFGRRHPPQGTSGRSFEQVG